MAGFTELGVQLVFEILPSVSLPLPCRASVLMAEARVNRGVSPSDIRPHALSPDHTEPWSMLFMGRKLDPGRQSTWETNVAAVQKVRTSTQGQG